MNSNSSSNTSSPSGYRAIAPSPQSMSIINPMIPISPHQSPQTRPNQHMISLPPPFGTPPVSPFSHPMANGEYLPPPLQPLPPMMSLNAPPSPTSGRILPKQKGPATSVFSIPMTPSNANSVIHHYPYQQHRVSINGTTTITNGDKQQLSTADQRELARKVSHSAIERRRRERINDKIMQLKELIPSCADQDHLHKLSILQSAIEYIQYLQGCVAESRKRGTDNNEERNTKKSKFDRYEIPIPKSLNNNNNNNNDNNNNNSSSSSNNNDDDSDDSEYKRKNNKTIKTKTKTKKETSDASTNTDPVKSKKHQSEDEKEKESISNEEADALLLLSKSSPSATSFTTENTDGQKISKTRDVEIQTFSNVTEIEDDEVEEEVEEIIPRRRMTVQQLLCN